MRSITLSVLLVLSCLCVALAHLDLDDCCLKYVNKMSHRAQRHAVMYRVQLPDGGCNLHAIVLTMRRGRKLCADPRGDWVKDVMKRIDDREERQGRTKTIRKSHRHVSYRD